MIQRMNAALAGLTEEDRGRVLAGTTRALFPQFQ